MVSARLLSTNAQSFPQTASRHTTAIVDHGLYHKDPQDLMFVHLVAVVFIYHFPANLFVALWCMYHIAACWVTKKIAMQAVRCYSVYSAVNLSARVVVGF